MASLTPIFNMFARSPLRPLQAHMTKAQTCAEGLLPFIDAALQQDWQAALVEQQNIARLESEADQLKKDLRLHLPKSLFLPVSRGDILVILTIQDKIANKAEDIAGLVLGRKMVFPESVACLIKNFIAQSIKTSAQAHKAINELDELLETGFRGAEVKLVEDMIVELDKLEHQTDEMLAKIRDEIFKIEKELPPIDAMFLYKAVEWIGDLADRAQVIGGQLQLLLAR